MKFFYFSVTIFIILHKCTSTENDLISKLDKLMDENPNKSISQKATTNNLKPVKKDEEELNSIKNLLGDSKPNRIEKLSNINPIMDNVSMKTSSSSQPQSQIKSSNFIPIKTGNPSNLSNFVSLQKPLPFTQNDSVNRKYIDQDIGSENKEKTINKSEIILSLLAERRLQKEKMKEKENLISESLKESFSKSVLKDSDIIFEHIFINPNSENNLNANSLYFDSMNKEFILPNECKNCLN
jgi:hypothetical protein